ncbi:MAG: hypothetical protein RLZ97_1536 [Verrucomicrobiota bacterium]|jgi:hypothetical protein
MRYLIAVIDTQTNSGTAEESASVDDFNQMLEANGHWITAGGVEAPRNSKLIDNRSGANNVGPGPLNDGPEFMSGFWIIEAEDDATALDLAKQGSKACNRKVELRRYLR